jgi:hypothetical protein
MRSFLWFLIVTLGALDSPVVIAQSASDEPASAAEVQSAVKDAIEIRQTTQQQQDVWAQERAELLVRYRNLGASVGYLSERKQVEIERATELQADVEEFTRRFEESDRFEASLLDTLLTIFDNLKEQVETDLPFLGNERSARLKSVRKELIRTDVEPAEKLRRLLEALLIEAQYGSGFEIYDEDIMVNGQELAVSALRLGRLALFWRTPDGQRAGQFDRASGTWIELSGSGRRAVNGSMDMAMHRRQHEVLRLPLGRIAP